MFSYDVSNMARPQSTTTTTTTTTTTLRRESSQRSSVHSMRSPFPLLLSPAFPAGSASKSSSTYHHFSTSASASASASANPRPRPSLDHRATFGTSRPSTANNHLGLSLPLPEISRAHHHRDTPIYYTDNHVCYNCSLLSASDYDKRCCIFPDDDHPKRSSATEKQDDDFASQSNTVGGNNISRMSYFSNGTDIPRSSCLSFQCSGELFPNEGEWLRSPLPDSPKPSQIGRSSGGRPPEHHVESWLSDTSELYVGCDILARATILSPGRAQVIEVNRSDLHLSGATIPPRVSSLSPPPSYPGDSDSWASSSDSPPDTPCGEWEFDDNHFSRQQQPHNPPRIFPRGRRQDVAMVSPPMSPVVTLDPPAAASRFSIVGAGTERHVINASLASRLSLESAATSPKSDLEIISELEDAVSGFASTMLGLDTPCIATIRAHLAHSRSPRASQQATECQKVKNFSRPRRPNQLTTSRSSPMMNTATTWRESMQSSTTPIGPTSGWRSCPSLGSLPPAQSPPPPLPSPHLEALHRIFPDSAAFVRRALYAHILAYTFLASFPDPPATAASSPAGWRRRGSPYWSNSPKLAAQHTSTFASDFTMQLRAASLKAGLRKSIFRLMTIMGSGAGSVEVLLRAVVEVVRASEVKAFAGTRNAV